MGVVKKIIQNTVSSTNGTLKEPVIRMGVSELEPERYTMSIQVWVDAHKFEDSKFILQGKILNDLK